MRIHPGHSTKESQNTFTLNEHFKNLGVFRRSLHVLSWLRLEIAKSSANLLQMI